MDAISFNLQRTEPRPYRATEPVATPIVDAVELQMLREFYATWVRLHSGVKKGRPSKEHERNAERLVELGHQLSKFQTPASVLGANHG